MEEQPADMTELGPPDIVLEILNGKRDLTVTHIHALAETFQVSPAVFVCVNYLSGVKGV